MVRVSRVHPDSIAAELGIEPGTELRSVNGREIADFLDWEFLTADDELVIEARLPNGDDVVFDVERPEGETMGVDLEPPTIRRCANRCEFCFIEGLPKGMRKPLYIRDDDYRLSFAYGNFATLSNLKDRDFERILAYRLSPLYVSVHATPWEARKVLLNNPRVPDILAQLRRLAEGGIQFHGQMVIVPGLNDGDVLEQSLLDLWSFDDAVISVAMVPVGLTQFSHLYTGRTMDRAAALQLLETSERWAERAIRRAMPSILQAYLCGVVEQEAFATAGANKSDARTFSTAAAVKTWADRHTGSNPGAIRAATEFALEAVGLDGRGSRHTGSATHAEHYRKFVEDRVRDILSLFTQRSDSSKLSNFWQSRETRDMRKPMLSLRDVDAGGIIQGATRDPWRRKNVHLETTRQVMRVIRGQRLAVRADVDADPPPVDVED